MRIRKPIRSCMFACGCITIAFAMSMAGPTSAAQDDAATRADDESFIGRDGVDRRNPRRKPETRVNRGGPRMVAGSIPINNDDGLRHYRKLEPMIGHFSFEGRQWRQEDAEPIPFAGAWTNTWELDGQFMRSEFTVEGDAIPYRVIAFTWFDDLTGRFESHVMNNRNTMRTHRFGDFGESEASADTLFMMSRASSEATDADPRSKVTFEIVSVDEFIYTGWRRNADDSNAWARSYELTCTRIDAAETADDQAAADDEESTEQAEAVDDR